MVRLCGLEIVPVHTFDVVVESVVGTISDPVNLPTGQWGDTVEPIVRH